MVITALTAVDTGARGGGPSHGPEQQPSSGTDTRPLIATDRRSGDRANHGTQCSIAHCTVICRLIRPSTTDLSTGVTTTEVIINAKLIKALSSTRQRQHAGPRRQICATRRRDNESGHHHPFQLRLHDLNILL
jgi:hypothetical protein